MKKIKYPPYMQWEVTPRCNHNCVHCYNYWRSTHELISENELYTSIASKIIDIHPVSVVITGGEPLLVFDKIKDASEMLLNNDILVSLNTNASLVTENIAFFLKKHNISAFVSLPCAKEEICNRITNTTNAFSRTTRGIRILRAAGVRVTVNMVVMKSNIDYIYDTAKFVKEKLNVDSFFASRVGKPINARSEFECEMLDLLDFQKLQSELLKIKNELNIRIGTAGPIPTCSIDTYDSFMEFAYEKGCGAGKTTYSIDSNGNIKACPRDDKIYGNILIDNFDDVWNKMEEWRDESLLPEECRNCSVKSYCGGGCRLDSFPFTNRRDAMDTMANVDNLPIKYIKKHQKSDILIDENVFVPNTLIYVNEEFGYRVSNFNKMLYITDEMKSFLDRHDYFTAVDFAKENNVDIETATEIINLLVNNNILYTKQICNKMKDEVRI